VKSKTKRRRVIWIVSTAVVVIALIAGGSLLIRQRANADSASEPEPAATAFLGTLSTEASASGQLVAQREAALSLALAGRVEQVYVAAGDQVQAGDPLVLVESASLERAVRRAEQTLVIQEARLAELLKPPTEEDLAAAEAAVASAQAQLVDVTKGPNAVDLTEAETAVASAQAQLDDLLAGASKEALAEARAALASAQVAERASQALLGATEDQLLVTRQQLTLAEIDLESAKYFYNALANDWQHKDYAPFSPEAEVLKDAQKAYQVALARYNLAAADINDSAYRGAQAQVAQARASLSALTDEKTVQIASAREQLATAQANLAAITEEKTVQIASARAQLKQAEANMAKLRDGPSDEQLAIAEAQVEQARIAVQNARAMREDATLVAPMNGVITAVNVNIGEQAAGRPAVEMVDSGTLELVLDVDEVDIGNIAVGQSTNITLETWPDQELSGEVTAIASKARPQSEIVTYQVHIRFDAGLLPVRTGMTANADLVTAKRENVLLVPNRAITADRQTGTYSVRRIDGETTTEVQVTIGMRDNNYTEITRGLEAGDQVSIAETQQGFAFGPGGRQ
jgi:multidrug efflux pump subunit AcrA (membrane-fusion protein)